MKALQIHAGATALKQLREHGLQPADVRIIPAAAGGPKGLVLNPLDRYLFGEWLAARHAHGAPAGRVDRRLAHGHRLPGRPRDAAWRRWRTTTSTRPTSTRRASRRRRAM